MIKFNEIPDCVITHVYNKGITEDSIVLFAAADRLSDCTFCHVYFAVTKETLHIITGLLGDEQNRTYTGYRVGKNDKKARPEAFRETAYETIPMSDIDSFEILQQSTNSTLYIKINGEARALCSFSASAAKQLHRFVRLAGIVKDGREITEADLSDDEYLKYCPKCGNLYPDQNRELCPKCLDRRSLFIRVLKYLKPYRFKFAMVLLTIVAINLLKLLPPILTGTVFIDQVLNPEGRLYGQIFFLVMMVFGADALSQFFQVLQYRLNAVVSTEMSNDIRVEIFNSIQRLSMNFLGKQHSGSLMTRVNNDAVDIQYFFIDALPQLLSQLINMVIIPVYLIILNWKLALIVFIPVPIIFYISFKFIPKIRKMYDRVWIARSSRNSVLNDSINGMRVVKAFGKEGTEIKRFDKVSWRFRTREMLASLFQNTFFPLIQLLMGLSIVLVWGFGSLQVFGNVITIGELSTTVTYISMLYGPIIQISYMVFHWSNAMNSAQRIFEILDATPEITDKPDAKRLDTIKGDISINNISFAYTPTKPILTNISVDIKAGQMLGIVGHSGAGKSTLVNLVNRLYDVKLGSIKIDGIDIRDIYSEDLKKQVGIVSQETFVFMGSIFDNIAFAKPEASKEEIIAASKAASAHDFIMKLPDGYDTQIGHGIRDLSGGERQRISIARAILHNPRILILDEATSAVDTETERNIQEALEVLVKGRTTISIAHRLSTLRNADYLIVIEGGKIAEAGTHLELIKKRGIYYEMMQLQTKALAMRGVAE